MTKQETFQKYLRGDYRSFFGLDFRLMFEMMAKGWSIDRDCIHEAWKRVVMIEDGETRQYIYRNDTEEWHNDLKACLIRLGRIE